MSGAKGATMTWATNRASEKMRDRLGSAMEALRNAARALDARAAGWLTPPRARRCGLRILECLGVLVLVAGAEVLALWLLAG